MIGFEREPLIRIGLMTRADEARITLGGSYVTDAGEAVGAGNYVARREDGKVQLTGETAGAPVRAVETLRLSPTDFEASRVTVHDVTIGIEFHWQRKEAQQFQGALMIQATDDGLTIINELPLESYLISVISSEMSAACPPELLRAHAVVSRSWLLAQLASAAQPSSEGIADKQTGSDDGAPLEIIRWYGRENHSDFDVCADDHCQRYQGISKAFSPEAFSAVRDTRGKAMVWGDEVCDTRYSKSCGGMTEVYAAGWDDRDVPYLAALYDGADDITAYAMPLTVEANADAWIRSAPPAFCNTQSKELLSRILPGFDQETMDFYRWRVRYTADELREIIKSRLGIDAGRIRSLEAIERGESGRIIRLQITAERQTLIIGKELEIRRALSRSHLYSSAFVVDTEAGAEDYPQAFTLIGAGWGHGVGLCQIGAAVMADRGYAHGEILAHYFPGARLQSLY
ncbi:MAG TPA: SpoIID/LytB domain-containing protein [Blastocatellia bacterium]|nr:SpoIID/LytB domain-containing protein [Blastocatellia bacterium]